MKIPAFFLMMTIFFSGGAMAQVYQPNEEIDAVKITGNLYLMRDNSKRGNPNMTVFSGKDGVLLVDTGFASFGDKLSAKIKQLGGSKVRYVVNTHWHGDHTGGNETFGAESSIIARTAVRRRLLKQGIIEDNDRLIERRGFPDLLFDADQTLFFNDEEIKIIAPPAGHTDGDAIVYFAKANVVSVGDYFFMSRFPVIDIEDSGADLEGYLKNVRFILENFPADAKIVPGHSAFYPVPLKFASMTDLKNWYEMLLESIAVIRQKIKQGKTPETIQAEGLPEKFAVFDEKPRFVPAAAWIETVYKTYKNR